VSLPPDELIRYARHLTLAEIGVAGQERLKAARVVVVGAGGLGSPALLYLAAAGVGTLGVVDYDRVDLTNLQRQILHGTSRLGHSKLVSAAERLADLNPTTTVQPHQARLTAANALELLGGYDVVVDGSDNFPTRYLVNDACVLLGKPLIYGSIFRFDGQVSVFGMPGGPCYRCLFAEPPPPHLVPSCAEAGVLGVLPGVIGTLQATEAIKLVLGLGEPLIGRLLLYDGLAARFREIGVRPDPACPVCGTDRTIHSLIDYEAFCGVAPGGGEPSSAETTVAELAALLRAGAAIAVIDVREPWEAAIARIPGSVVIPLGELPSRLSELDPNHDIVTVCHRGQRSLVAQQLLSGAGFRVKSLAGGIDGWAARIDPTMSRY
jgi:adenylyltransferase/sulfurtransferase